MKKRYTYFIYALVAVQLSFSSAYAQCSDGSTQGTTAFDTTIQFPTGVNNTQVQFPKFDPQEAMVTCVRLIVTITGIIDTVAMQNYSASSQTASFVYNRKDSMSGPGLTPPLAHSSNDNFGPYNLTPYDGIPGSGSDFQALPRDTVLQQVMIRTLTDSTAISEFYGLDSVTYNYNINVTTSAIISGGSSSSLVLTSALVNFRLEYCTCPIAVLPMNLKQFIVKKSGDHTAILQWKALDSKESYYYEIETSRDGFNYSKIGAVNKKTDNLLSSYSFVHDLEKAASGKYFYRLKQVWADGNYKYSEIRYIEFEDARFLNVNIFPNPSSGQAALKFVAAKPGEYSIEVTNAQGQLVIKKLVNISSTDYIPLTISNKGMYYVKIMETTSKTFCIRQLVIQ